ncbi:MAG: hypothetical protein GXP08_14655 [Gammaproteobacteria bacterium]|nr:hypothetical protein [Gammaproteobacteria bacterium]
MTKLGGAPDAATLKQAEQELQQLETAHAALAADAGLAAAGALPPPWGTAADVVSLGKSLWRGDWGGALLDVVGFIPLAGDAIKGTKIAARLKELKDKLKVARSKLARVKQSKEKGKQSKSKIKEDVDKAVKGCSEQKCPGNNAPNKINSQKLELVTSHPNAHSIVRHGGDVTNVQLKQRALTGVAPDGHVKVVKGKTILPPMSSAFHSDNLLIHADQAVRNNGALKTAIANNPGKSFITVKPAGVGDLGVDLGRGFQRISGSKFKPELQGAPRLIENLRSVQATYEFNPATKAWETITIFPSR